MPLKILPASGSGSATLVSVAGTTTNDTLTLPARTGNIITSADTGTVTGTMLASAAVAQSNLASNIAGTGPAFSAYLNSTQIITTSTLTKVACATEDFDTNSNYDSTTNYRFTPTVAGYYLIVGNVYFGTNAAGSVGYISIYKNGGSVALNQMQYTSNSITLYAVLSLSKVIYFNGSTDYVELYAYITATNPYFVSGGANTFFTGAMVRGA